MIYAADLFAGAGGASTGLRAACRALGVPVSLVAVNHWPVAVATHAKNHPDAVHYCAPVETLDPRAAVPGGKLDILIAAPSPSLSRI
jgi:DNA (cytosine-5)-methyltransferase 1